VPSIDGRGVAEHHLQDTGLRELPESGACVLTPRACGPVLAGACVSVSFEPGDRDLRLLCRLIREPVCRPGRLQCRHDLPVPAAKLLAGRAERLLPRGVLDIETIRLGLLIPSAAILLATRCASDNRVAALAAV
jgi:hypothetical protein